MLRCGMPSSSARRPNCCSSLQPLQGSSDDDNPSSSSHPCGTVNLTREFSLATQTDSYSEIWSKIHPSDPSYQDLDVGHERAHEEQLLVQVLKPSRDSVQEAIRHARPDTVTHLFSLYFEQSEKITRTCLNLHGSILHARSLYHGLHNLFDVHTLDCDPKSLTQSLCDSLFDFFLQFDRFDNPFTHPDLHIFHGTRHHFSELNQQLHHRLCKSRSRVRLIHRPLLPALLPSKITKKELAHLAQLDAAAKGSYVLHNDLDTIDRLAERSYAAVEGDKFLIRHVLQSGPDRHFIHAVAKQLQKNHHSFLNQLMELEKHICLCFAAINRARSLLLEKIHLHQSDY